MPRVSKALCRKIRVLCLHGYRTNARVMEAQTLVLQKALGSDDAEFIFLDAPFEAEGPTDPVIQKVFGEHAPFREWFRIPPLAKGSGDSIDSDLNSAEEVAKVRGAMDQSNEWYLGYEGIEQSIAFIDETIRARGPIDVVVGFSQGAILLTILSALYLHKHGVRLWKLAICVGGLRVMDPQFRHLFETLDSDEVIPVPFSSVHIIGKKDPIYRESQKLVKMFEAFSEASGDKAETKIVYEHSGGHKFPSLKGNEVFYGELVKVIREHSSADSSSQSVSTGAAPSKL